MIIKANRHNNGGQLARYMMTGDAEKGERAECYELRGFGEAANITEAFRDLEIMAAGTKAENALFHVQVRLLEHERLTRQQWEHAADRIEKRLGLTGQPRAIYFHVNEQTGAEHMHVGWSLIDTETMKAKPLPFFKLRAKALARELEEEFDLTRVKNERDGPIPYAATKDEQQQAQRLGVDKDAIRNTIRACWDRSDCGRTFENELTGEGLILAQGSRRDYVVLDHAGGPHALGKRILGATAAQVREKLADLDREQVPTIEDARQFLLDLPRDRMDQLTGELSKVQKQIETEREYAERDPVREDMAWHDALEQAAIEKEKTERQFAEDRGTEIRAEAEQPDIIDRLKRELAEVDRLLYGPSLDDLKNEVAEVNNLLARQWQKEKEEAARQTPPPKPVPPNLGKTAGQIRLAYSLTSTGQEFANALEDRGLILAQMTEADAERLNRWERQRIREHWEAPRPQRDEWMAQRGGVSALTPEQEDDAHRSYDKWLENREPGKRKPMDFEKYVTFVQERDEEKQPGNPDYQKYRNGEIVVVDRHGAVHQLTMKNTGDSYNARAEHLKTIDRAALPSVTSAEGAMKQFQQHQRGEWQHNRDEKQQQWERNRAEQHWPVKPPQPESKSWMAFAEAAAESTRDDRTHRLTGQAARVWNAWRQSDPALYAKVDRALEDAFLDGRASIQTKPHAKTFAAALDDGGVSFAVATKEEAERSRKQAEFSRAVGRYAPRFKEGEIVIVTERSPDYRRDGQIIEPPRVHKIDPTLAAKFLKTLDNKNQLQGIDATLKVSDKRAQQRAADRQATRLENATDLKDFSRKWGKGTAPIPALENIGPGVIALVIAKGFDIIGSLLESVFAPKLTPEQIHEGEKAQYRREAEAEHSSDISRHTADQTQQRRQQENEQEAARQRQRDEAGGRER